MEVFCSLKKKPSKLSGSWKSIRLKKNHQSGPKIPKRFSGTTMDSVSQTGSRWPRKWWSWKLCWCFDYWESTKNLEWSKNFLLICLDGTRNFHLFHLPPRITRHASHASFRSKALRRLIILGTRHPVRRKWSNILGPVGSAKLKPTSKLIPLSVDIYISLNIHENQLASLDIYVCEACLFFVCL